MLLDREVMNTSHPQQPLAGLRIVVTRAAEQASGLRERLAEAGAEAILFPTIQFVPLSSERLTSANQESASYHWLLFTSANAVEWFFHYVNLNYRGLPPIAVVGKATAAKLAEYGLQPAYLPAEYSGEALAAGLGDLSGQRILLPRSRQGRPQLVEQLRAQGAAVDEIPIYDTIPAEPDPSQLETIRQGVDVITFTSPSSVHAFLTMLKKANIQWSTFCNTLIACIGPTTAQVVEQAGLAATITAAEHTAEGLVQALIAYYTAVCSNGFSR